ncbi:N-lysine methyltransferase setd6 [Desmophyllum pertusum]|uniref:N-lysine methyltransferase setd6 n=1 Tax=Desmophyllum pertusum TaxID=174260 RepID=A0A9W9Z9G5_9CNID|nr:N-lysine methyltransferase setd6 [Desmophyllum pertusum]
MAYSFTEQKSSNEDDDEDDDDDDDGDDPAPAMVPMADILNHISNNNAHLEFGAETLTMVATQDIHKGEEVFNTYGKLANCHLLQSYGFVEDELPNPYDMVDIPISAFIEVTKASQSQQTARVLDAKFEFMEEMGVASEDDMFLFGREGCSHFGPDLYATLRILHLSERQFQQLLQQQIQQQRSEEFDDIGYVLDQSDEEMKKDTRWRILELIFKAENKKKKRGLDENDTEMKQKKKKKIHVEESDSMEQPEDWNLGVTVERNSQGKSTCLNGSLQTDNVTSEPNESKNDCSNLPQTDLDTNVDRSKDLSKNSKHNLVEGEGGNDDDDENDDDDDDDDDDGGDKGHNSDDGDDDDDDDDDVDNDHNSNNDDDDDVDDDHNSNINDGDDDVDDDDDDDDDNDDDQDESEQPLTYGK